MVPESLSTSLGSDVLEGRQTGGFSCEREAIAAMARQLTRQCEAHLGGECTFADLSPMCCVVLHVETIPSQNSKAAASVRRMFSQKKEVRKDTVFSDKGLLDPSRVPTEILGGDAQSRRTGGLPGRPGDGLPAAPHSGLRPAGHGQEHRRADGGLEGDPLVPRPADRRRQSEGVPFRLHGGQLEPLQITGVKEPAVSGLDGVVQKLWASVKDTKYLVLILDDNPSLSIPRHKRVPKVEET